MAELFHLEQDITVLCVTAERFPEGVLAAHQKLHSLVRFFPERKYFGISHPAGQGKIVYHAATEQLPEDNADLPGCDIFFIKKGAYISIEIANFMADISSISRTFELLLQDSRIDPNGYCLEWYLGQHDVRCMVPVVE
jgi:hypothetical protein